MKVMMMKTLYSIGSGLAVLAALAGCTKSIEPECQQSYILTASSDGVRTALSGRQVVWEEGDEVSLISYSDDILKYSVASGITPSQIDGSKAVFEIKAMSQMQPRILVYPGKTDYELSAEGLVGVPVDVSFPASAGCAPEKGIYSLGFIEDGKVQLRNLFSFMKVVVTSDNISAIRLLSGNGEALSGKLWFDPVTLEVVSGENNYIEIVPSGSAESFVPGEYLVPVPSCTLTKGFTLKFFRTDKTAAKKIFDSSYTVERNKFIQMGSESDWNLEYKAAVIDFDIVFSDGTESVFPFSTDPAATEAVACPAVASIAGKGLVGPYYAVGYPGHAFYFNVAVSATKTYFAFQAGYGMRLGGTAGDYMLLPAIEGYRLTALTLVQGSTTAWYFICSHPSSGDPVLLTAANVQINKNTTKSYTFTSAQTASGAAYRLCSADMVKPTSVKELKLKYEEVD